MRRAALVLLAVVLPLFVSTAAYADDPPAPPGTPTAVSFDGLPTVGPLFSGALALGHGCTASVIASRHHDQILTAAHCVSGTAAGWSFAPGYDKGRTPYGVWTVTAAFVDKAWATTQDTQHDFAVLRLAHKRSHGRSIGVQDVVGANIVASAPRAGTHIVDVAYNAGVNDQPIACRTRVYYTDGYPSFNCHGYVGGSSGSPWLSRAWWTRHLVVRGVIGGLHQGGCFEYTSYSSRFGTAIHRLAHRASVSRSGDVVPEAGSDGC